MAAFAGTLNKNEIYNSLYNMIISQEVFSDRVGTGNRLVDMARVDGSLYGDTKLYYSADVLASHAWGNDAEATNLLALNRPKAPEVQGITLDVFRQIDLTLDDYLSKRAWSDEGVFGQFTALMDSMLGKTKRIYDVTTYSAFLGTTETEIGAQEQAVSVTSTSDTGTVSAEDEAKAVAEKIADILDDMEDFSRDYNDYGQATLFDRASVKVIWNSAIVNRLLKKDTPSIYHKDGLIDKIDSEKLNAKYFGTVNSEAKAGDGASVRSLIEQTIGTNHYFAGELIKTGDTAPAGTSYTEDNTIACKILIKLPPYMSAFEVGTTFFNPKSLTTNRYLTWGHNTLEYLKGYPLITLRINGQV